MDKLLEVIKQFLKFFRILFENNQEIVNKPTKNKNLNDQKNSKNNSPSKEITDKLDLYFTNLVKYFKYDLFSDYKGYFFSIKIENIQNLEKEYSEIKASRIKFPFYSDLLTDNIDEIILYLNNKLESQNISISNNEKTDYNFLLNKFKKHLIKGAHYEILKSMESFIDKDNLDEIETWKKLYDSEPSSMLI